MLKLYFITAFGSVKCEEVSNTDLSLSLKGIVRACDLSALHRFSQVEAFTQPCRSECFFLNLGIPLFTCSQ